QSEVDIAALADITIVVLVPEGGDVIQTMKAGLMEVADIFVINKYDRPGAAIFFNTLTKMLTPAFRHSQKEIPILKTIASGKEGVSELYKIIGGWNIDINENHKLELMTEKAWSIIQANKMKEINKEELKSSLSMELSNKEFNIYLFAEKYSEQTNRNY
ncbi:MAG: methylmalonyl Co-A mutase-associated GTPase MeaB, partial [Ginsengibacter sp.]